MCARKGTIAAAVALLVCAGCADDAGGSDACGPLEIGHCVLDDGTPCGFGAGAPGASFSPLTGDGNVSAVMTPHGGYVLLLAMRAPGKAYIGSAGAVEVTRNLYRESAEHKAICPLEVRAGIIDGKATPMLARQVCFLNPI